MSELRATCSASRAASGQAGSSIRFTASTPGVKRDKMNLDQGAWYLENYRRNPVVLWAHDYRALPIGRATVATEPGRLVADVTFDQADEFARLVEQKYRDGYMHAVSVGWDEIEIEGRQLYDLLDVSAVAVPGDPDALMERAAARAYKRYLARTSQLDQLALILTQLNFILRRRKEEQLRRKVDKLVKEVLSEML